MKTKKARIATIVVGVIALYLSLSLITGWDVFAIFLGFASAVALSGLTAISLLVVGVMYLHEWVRQGK